MSTSVRLCRPAPMAPTARTMCSRSAQRTVSRHPRKTQPGRFALRGGDSAEGSDAAGRGSECASFGNSLGHILGLAQVLPERDAGNREPTKCSALCGSHGGGSRSGLNG